MSKFKPTQSGIILLVGIFILFVTCLYPFLVLLKNIVKPAEVFTLQYFVSALSSKATLKALTNTFVVSFFAATLGLVISLPLSWLLTRTDLKRASMWKTLYCLPYAIPPYIAALAWIYLANPTNGILNLAMPIFNIYSYTGIIWVMASSLYAFNLLSLTTSLERMDSSLEEAAKLSGASAWRVYFDITFPLIRPAMLSGFLLVFLSSAATFGVPAMIGNPARIYLITTRIYTFQKMGSLSGIYKSGALSLSLLFLTVAILLINNWINKKKSYQIVSGKTSRPSLLHLEDKQNWVQLILFLGFSVLFLLPLIGIIITAFNQNPGSINIANFGLGNFKKLFFEIPETTRAFKNSFILASVVGLLACVVGMVLSYIQHKTKIKFRSSIEVMASLPYSTPGTVLALALILSFSASFLGLPISLYNTLTLIGVAYFAKYLNFAIRTSGDGFTQIHDSLAEASRICGASWLQTLRYIWFPLMKTSLIASFFLIFMPAFSELTMTILLSGPGLETVGTVLFQLQEYADSSGGASAVMALIIITLVCVINFTVKKLSKGKYGL